MGRALAWLDWLTIGDVPSAKHDEVMVARFRYCGPKQAKFVTGPRVGSCCPRPENTC